MLKASQNTVVLKFPSCKQSGDGCRQHKGKSQALIAKERKDQHMQIKNMSYLIALAEEGTLSGAGKRLGISQPTLSVFLSGLEQELGMDLFLRDKKKLILTPAGRIYLEAAKRILATQERTLQSIRQLSATAPIELLIGVTPLRGSEIASKVFSQFSSRYPSIRVSLRDGYMRELRQMVLEGVLSFSLGTCFDTESADFDYITLFREEIVVAVPAFHPLALHSRQTSSVLDSHSEFPQVKPEELSDSPFILMTPGNTIRNISSYIFTQARFTPTVVYESSNTTVMRNMVRGGSGIAFLPRSAAQLDDPEIAYLSLSPRYSLDLCIILRKGKGFPIIRWILTKPADPSGKNSRADSCSDKQPEKLLLPFHQTPDTKQKGNYHEISDIRVYHCHCRGALHVPGCRPAPHLPAHFKPTAQTSGGSPGDKALCARTQ